MTTPSQSKLLEVATKHVRAAEAMYAKEPSLSCDQRFVAPPRIFKVETPKRELHLIVTAANDPRALTLVTETLKPIRSTDNLLIISPPGASRQVHLIPGILSNTAKTLNVPLDYPFVSITNPNLISDVEARSKAEGLSFTRAQLIGGIVSNAAIGNSSNIKIDTLGGARRLYTAWSNRFPLNEILRGALELQNPGCREEIYRGCLECVDTCVAAARREGANSSPENPDFIEKIIRQAERTNTELSRHHILGYAVCSLSPRAHHTIPDYIHSIMKAYETWNTEISLEEIYHSVTDWLVSHQPDFDSVLSDNAKIARVVTGAENHASAANLKSLFSNSQKSVFVGCCRLGEFQAFQGAFAEEG